LSSKFYIFTFLLFSNLIGFAQIDGVQQEDVRYEDNLFFDGEISNYYTGESISGVNITAISGGKVVAKGQSDAKGEYKLVIDFDKEYTITFSKPGLISKKISMNTEGVPESKRFKCPDMSAEITLFKPNECIKADMLKKPVGRAIYFPKKNVIEWDMVYSMPLLASLNEMLDDCAKQAEEEERLEAQKEKDYIIAMKTADKAFAKEDWEIAKETYKEAITLFNDRPEPKNKLKLIETEIAKKAEAEKQRAEEKARAEAEAIAKAEVEAAAKKEEEERLAKEKAEALAKTKAEAEAKEKEKAAVAAKKAEEERIAKEKAEALAKTKAEAETKEKEKAAIAVKKAEEERIAKEKAEALAKAEEDTKAKEQAEIAAAKNAAAEKKQLEEKEKALAQAKEEEKAKNIAKTEALAKQEAEKKAKQDEAAALVQMKKAEKEKLEAQKEAKKRKDAEAKALKDKQAAKKREEEERKAKEAAAQLAQKAEDERAINQVVLQEKKKEVIVQIAIQEEVENKATLKATEEVKPKENNGSSGIKMKNRSKTRHLYQKPNKLGKGKGPQPKKRIVF
jgi:hypothetical protein